MNKFVVFLSLASLLPILVVGCAPSTPQPTPKSVTDQMKADNAKHDQAMATAAKAHDAEAATTRARTRGTTPPPITH